VTVRGAGAILWAGPEEIVLASRSARRAALLAMLGVPFRVSVPPEDGVAGGAVADPAAYTLEQALEKCRAVAASIPADRPSLVVAADTIVVIEGAVLEKPADEAEARSHLRRLANRRHTVVTGVAVQRTPDGREVSGTEATEVTMSALDDETIDLYVRTGEPMDKAGAYGIQGIGAQFISSVVGCYFNVVGLPLARLRALLVGLAG
jgi:septum formation protein